MALQEVLKEEVRRLGDATLQALLAREPDRARTQALRCGPLYASFARQTWDAKALEHLFALAREAGVAREYRRLLDGEPVNATEHRAALHTALRGNASQHPRAATAHAQACATRAQMRELYAQWRAAGLRDVVSLGIGGSDLGPRLLADALGHERDAPRLHFVSNVDGHSIARTLEGLEPARTGLVAISKSFTTAETLANLQVVRAWAGNSGIAQCLAVTANTDAALAHGFAAESVLPMWDWVGGRYSLWSAVGFCAALAIGFDRFEVLLEGAAAYDAHCAQAPPEQNPSLWHALAAVWNRNARGLASHLVVPYDERLRLLPAYLQQLVMESLGKSAALGGGHVAGDTVPVWWGSAGTDAQHSYFQALHQGTQVVPVDFIGVVQPDHMHAANHTQLLANLLAQAEALANGRESTDLHCHYPGGRPSSMLLLDRLDAAGLGTLLAFYEHSVHAQGVLWGINAFDQFGVELGKTLACKLKTIPCAIEDDSLHTK